MKRALPTERLPERSGNESQPGLCAAEVTERRHRFGANDILETQPNPWQHLARETLRDPMIWFLAGISALYFALGQRVEGFVLTLAVIPFIGMDAYLHRRTQASTEGLKSRLAATANVVRDGDARRIPASEVVVGDLALVAPGELFPADGLIVGGDELQAEESSLTGEAFPVHKKPVPLPLERSGEQIIDGSHWGFAGTRLLTGAANLRVVFTGPGTLYGEIVQSARRSRVARTPLQVALAELVWMLMIAAAIICVALAFVRWRQGYGWVDAMVSAATLAVAAVPEEFPLALTFFLGAGVYRLARRRALVRRATAVENIGRVSFICSDKTGTMTEGRLRIVGLVPAPGESKGGLLRIAARASRREGGDPLDLAILEEADRDKAEAMAVVRLATFPFTEARRRETAIVRERSGTTIAVSKGSPERILRMCALEHGIRDEWELRVALLAGEGKKVIACASQVLDERFWTGGEPDQAFQLAGLLVCEDPVRNNVPAAITACRDAGIHVLMVTGDHPATARAVAREIGLGNGAPVVVTPEEVEARLRSEDRFLRRVDAIARAIPSEKLDLVLALQQAGEVVAVTGDGVNDVPALQAADVGIAMGERGTRSAREVASIVLLDDNFGTIVRAIAEGRQLFENLRASFQYLLSIHIPLVITAALIPLAGYPLLYQPIHIVWFELVIHPTALLVFQGGASSERLDRISHRRTVKFFFPSNWLAIGAAGLLVTGVVMLGFDRSLGAATDVEHARSMVLVCLNLTSVAFAVALKGLRTRTSQVVAAATIALALLLVQVRPIAAVLHLSPLHADDWLVALAGALLSCIPFALGALRVYIARGWHWKPWHSMCKPRLS